MPKYLSKKAILEAEDRESVDVEVPEWGGTVRVMVPTAWELSELQNQQYKVTVNEKGEPKTTVDTTGHNVRLAAIAIVDEKGDRVFAPQEVRALGRKSTAALARVIEAVRGLGSMDEAIAEIEGNSEGTTADTGSSD